MIIVIWKIQGKVNFRSEVTLFVLDNFRTERILLINDKHSAQLDCDCDSLKSCKYLHEDCGREKGFSSLSLAF